MDKVREKGCDEDRKRNEDCVLEEILRRCLDDMRDRENCRDRERERGGDREGGKNKQ